MRYVTQAGLMAFFLAFGTPLIGDGVAPLASDSVNESVASFLSALTSPDHEQRERAGVYLLAIADLGEGKDWCDYRNFKTITLREFVFEYLKKQPAARRNAKVAPLILEALHSAFPCRGSR